MGTNETAALHTTEPAQPFPVRGRIKPTPREAFIQAVSEGREMDEWRAWLDEEQKDEYIARGAAILAGPGDFVERIALLNELRDDYAGMAWDAREDEAEARGPGKFEPIPFVDAYGCTF